MNITCIPALSNLSTRALGLHRYFCAKYVPKCVFEMECYRCKSYLKAGLSRVACWNANVMTVKGGQCGSGGGLCGQVREVRTVSAFCLFIKLMSGQRLV